MALQQCKKERKKRREKKRNCAQILPYEIGTLRQSQKLPNIKSRHRPQMSFMLLATQQENMTRQGRRKGHPVNLLLSFDFPQVSERPHSTANIH